MLLSCIQSKRFFKLFDPLTVYANDVLEVVSRDELFSGGTRGISEAAQAHVARELWENLNVIDRFVDENPLGFSFGELETVRSWRDGLTGVFIAWRFPDGALRFIKDGYAFEVRGFTTEIEGAFSKLPTVVQTTLLPFDGLIVYSEYIAEMNVGLGDGIEKAFAEVARRVEADSAYVSDAEGLMSAAADIREKELVRDLGVLASDLEAQEAGEADAGASAAGQHRGVLADMTEEEREEAVRKRLRSSLDGRLEAGSGADSLPWPASSLEERCAPGPVKTTVAELYDDIPAIDDEGIDEILSDRSIEDAVSKYETEAQREYARNLLAREFAQVRAMLSADGLSAYLAEPENIEFLLRDMTEGELEGYRKLAAGGGRLSVPIAGLSSLAGLPMPAKGLCAVFREGDTFELVMPAEAVEAARQVDWETLIARAGRRKRLSNFVEQVAELRGIAPLVEVLADYSSVAPDDFESLAQADEEIMSAIERGECGVCLLDDGKEIYLLHFELMWAYMRNRGKDIDDDLMMEVGPLDTMLTNLMLRQGSKPARMPTPEMLAEECLYDWKEKRPPVRAMRRFLDEHVPDAADDYFFADKVVEDLLEEAKWGGSTKNGAQVLFDILENNGFVPEQNQLQTLLNLWMNICNGLPIWVNNGWSPAELASADPDHPVFFNEDGSVKRVGRNELCPCGSGKKYKKCHGR